MVDYKTIIYEPGPVTRIIHNEPENNTFNYTFRDEYVDALRRFDLDRESCVAVTLSKGKHFCAGDGIQLFREPQGSLVDKLGAYTESDWRYDQERLIRVFATVWDIRKPLICAAQGASLDIGEDFLLSQDIIIMSEDAFIGTPMMRVSKNGVGLLCNFVPYRKAFEHYLTGWNMGAAELYNFGVINKVVPKKELEETAMRYATIFTRMPWETVKLAKNSLKYAINRRGAYESLLYDMEMNIDAQVAARSEGPGHEFYKRLKDEGTEAALDFRDKPFEEFGYSRNKVTRL
jgi:enoyl-CoA hydratase/carnithine racemase